MDKGYLKIYGNPDVETNFHPNQVYTSNGNYLKIKFKLNLLHNTYFWGGDSAPNWFSFEKGNGGTYPNLGSSTLVYKIDSAILTSENECTMILNNGSTSFYLNGSYLTGGTFSGTLCSNGLRFFIHGSSSDYNMEFYHFEVYDSNDTLQYNFVASSQNNEAKLKETVSGNYYSATGGRMEYVKLTIFEPSKSTFNFSSTGGNESFVLTAETGWTATTASDWVSLSQTTGTTGGTLTLTCNRNYTTSSRTATITFTNADSETFNITVNQKRGTTKKEVNKLYKDGELIFVRQLPKTV